MVPSLAICIGRSVRLLSPIGMLFLCVTVCLEIALIHLEISLFHLDVFYITKYFFMG